MCCRWISVSRGPADPEPARHVSRWRRRSHYALPRARSLRRVPPSSSARSPSAMQAQDLVFLLFAGVAAWLLLVRPQRARARALQEVREALTVGSRVITTAGLHATVAA